MRDLVVMAEADRKHYQKLADIYGDPDHPNPERHIDAKGVVEALEKFIRGLTA